ncbi:cell motility mediator [Capsaspora owczarzaki ATCC 30864]|uniref:Cell motility mediator n=1 Tax=Capsaspora owczarzaki (strain ATCC 30864) TaxID=595528 RepID=A0A0D2U8X1_CAPO3|nr:cell motility mediator [Capsaspora owczarzaki ATCC 30864]KJE91516.1 cell motility mediator [Capsaspora owczarzaki ATCC 30864]|eukprot:XP_004349394.1 cell motility mediator [Capsaspora owczarzaki ATCC 30864]
MSSIVREASHAGSWYDEGGARLESQLDGWLAAANSDADSNHTPARAIIAPHAGYSYSGPTAAFAYKQIIPDNVQRVFILGPSHHVYLKGCALSRCTEYATPLGNLKLDAAIIAELNATQSFEFMTKSVDEEEHSIEMHLPYIRKVFNKNANATIVPILVGALATEKEAVYGKILAPYLANPANIFVVSSDFCHWGSRFNYTYTTSSQVPIHESINILDHQGMALIERLDCDGFAAYLKSTKNTICGRHPIGVLLQAIRAVRTTDTAFQPNLKFVKYAQSSACKTQRDSSVSYASASLRVD